MERPNIQQLFAEKFETDFSLNNGIEFIFDTTFSGKEYNKIFNQFPDLPFPILLNDSNMPIIGEDGEPERDYTDQETIKHNSKQAMFRMAALLKLTVENTDIQELTLEEIIEILNGLSESVFEELEKKLFYIIKAKFNWLQERRQHLARHVLAFTDGEKLKRDNFKKEISQKRDKLFKRQDEIELLLKSCTDKKQIEKYYQELKEIEKQTDEYRKILVTEPEDKVKTSNGVTSEYLLLDLAEKYECITMDFLIRALKNELTSDEEIVLELMKAKHSLDGEENKRSIDKANKKSKGNKE